MVKANNVFINDKKCKASTDVSPGDVVTVKKNGFNFQFEVIKTIAKRVGAPIAVECYINRTSLEELNKYKDWFIGKAKPEVREKGLGRPTKKERREIEEYKENHFIEFDWDEE
jgi:ribosome-associated heat shock protein Hsp15